MPAKRKSAFSAVLREAQQHSETAKPLDSDTVAQQSSSTVELLEGEVVKQLHSETATQPSGDTVLPLYSETVRPLDRETVKMKKERKVSFYLTPEQEGKLYALEIEYYQRTGKRINRNDIVRFFIDQGDIESLMSMSL